MIVVFKDTATGEVRIKEGITEWQLTQGNWSCDCSRELLFNPDADFTGYCKGWSARYLVSSCVPEPSEYTPFFNQTRIVKEANREATDGDA